MDKDKLAGIIKTNIDNYIIPITNRVILVRPVVFFDVIPRPRVDCTSDSPPTVYRLPADITIQTKRIGYVKEHEQYATITLASGARIPVFPVTKPLTDEVKQALTNHRISHRL